MKEPVKMWRKVIWQIMLLYFFVACVFFWSVTSAFHFIETGGWVVLGGGALITLFSTWFLWVKIPLISSGRQGV